MSKEQTQNVPQYLYCAMSIGECLLASGAEVSRVEDTIRRICKAFGAERVDVFTITSSIIVTISSPKFGILTQTRRIQGMEYDLERLEQLNHLSRKICTQDPAPHLQEIQADLKAIEAERTGSFGKNMLMYALVSASFSLFFGGTALDAAASFLIGMLLKCLRTWFKKMDINPFLHTFFCSILGGLLANLLVQWGLGQSAERISIGNIMLLIPGVTMTNGIRDMFSGDMLSGLLRFVEALLLAAVIAFAFVLASMVV